MLKSVIMPNEHDLELYDNRPATPSQKWLLTAIALAVIMVLLLVIRTFPYLQSGQSTIMGPCQVGVEACPAYDSSIERMIILVSY